MGDAARFYDGVTAEVHEVDVRADGVGLEILRRSDRAVLARWPTDRMRVLGDVEHEAVPLVACESEPARLSIGDPAERARLAAAIPALARLAAAPPPIGRRIAVFGATLAASIAVAWVAVDLGSERLAPLTPHAWQVALGESVFGQLAEGRTRCEGKAGLDALDSLANRLAKAGGYDRPVSVRVLKGGPVNAYTLPGGIMVIYGDLIAKARDEAEVAGVMAHEIGHMVRYHSMKALARQYGVGLLLRSSTGGYTDTSGSLASSGGLLLALRNSRAAEREADASGVMLLEKLGLRADGVAGFFERQMTPDGKDVAAMAGILSTHPPTAERIEEIRRPPSGKAPFSPAEWRAVRAVCDRT